MVGWTSYKIDGTSVKRLRTSPERQGFIPPTLRSRTRPRNGFDSFPRSSVGTHTGTLRRPVARTARPDLSLPFSCNNAFPLPGISRCATFTRDAGASFRRSHAGAWERGFTRLYEALRGFTRLYEALRGFARLYEALRGFARLSGSVAWQAAGIFAPGLVNRADPLGAAGRLPWMAIGGASLFSANLHPRPTSLRASLPACYFLLSSFFANGRQATRKPT